VVNADPGPAADAAFMSRALDLARRGWGQTAPNPLVGAVIVRDGEIVGEGWHAVWGGPHAEAAALKNAGNLAAGATLYATLEPCNHHGKTPPCVDAILRSGVRRVVAAVRDPNPQAGGGLQRLRDAGVETTLGPGASEATELNAPFFFSFVSDRPWVTLKMAVSLDAAIAAGAGTTSRVTGESARRYAHELRAGHDAVAVGMGTVRADDPMLTVRDAPRSRSAPLRVVLSRSGRLSLTSGLAQSAAEVPVLVTAIESDPGYEQALGELGVEVLRSETLGDALIHLRQRGIRALLVEGGTAIAGALLDQDLVDRLILIQAPIIFGAGSLNAFTAVTRPRTASSGRLRVIQRVELDGDIATHYALREL
jgi:diaminohydroxyphosphoribosylaminopyrimidine deaminase / 5-amino-6-(5-phosphoribosylamino)uracil reductase